MDSPVTYRLFPGFLISSLLLERLLFLDLDLDLDLDLPRLLGEGDLDLPRLLGGGDLEVLLRLFGGGDLEEMVRTPLGGNGGGGGSGGEGDLEAARLLGGGELSLSAGGVMERAVYLTSLDCDIYLSGRDGGVRVPCFQVERDPRHATPSGGARL